MKNMQEIIVDKLLKCELPPLTILSSTPYPVPTQTMVNWMQQTLLNYFKLVEVKNTTPLTHEDVLFITHKSDSKTPIIKVDDLEELNVFSMQRPIKLKQKIVIFDDAIKLTETVLNKCLKIFEEPPEFLRLIILNPSQVELMATIRSRAKIFYVEQPTTKNENSQKIIDFFNRTPSFFQFVEEFKKESWSEQDLMETLLTQCAETSHKSRPDALLQMWRSWNEANTFHQSEQTRLHLFFVQFQGLIH